MVQFSWERNVFDFLDRINPQVSLFDENIEESLGGCDNVILANHSDLETSKITFELLTRDCLQKSFFSKMFFQMTKGESLKMAQVLF